MLILLAPFVWLHDKCSDGAERRAEQTARVDHQRIIEQAQRQKEEAARRELEAAIERRRREDEAAHIASESARVASLKASERAALLKRCILEDKCPAFTKGPALIYEAAGSPTERKQLESAAQGFMRARAQRERAQERIQAQRARAEARASAALLCCDGTNSPSCTCGNPRRGCCSHHGGVCGCSADM